TNSATGETGTFYSAIVERRIQVPIYDSSGKILKKEPPDHEINQTQTFTVKQEIFTNIRIPAQCDEKTLQNLENKALASVKLHEATLSRAVTDNKVSQLFYDNKGTIASAFSREDVSKGLYGSRSFTRASGDKGSIIKAIYS